MFMSDEALVTKQSEFNFKPRQPFEHSTVVEEQSASKKVKML
jgi:hypothetical protein